MDDKKLIKKLEAIIIKTLKKEGGASGLKPLKKAIEKLDKPKNFNLTKFLSKMKNVKKHKDSDYILIPINEHTLTKETIKQLIRETVLKEQAYGSATLTSQGQSIHRAPGVWETDPTDGTQLNRRDLRNRPNSIRIGEQPTNQQDDEEQKQKPKVKEKEPKHSLDKIGECKAGCVDLELENLDVKLENVELKLKDLAKRRADAKPSEVEGMEKERSELLKQQSTIDDQIEAKEEEKKKLLNPEKQGQNESKNKQNMKASVKRLWNDYAKSRINTSIKEKMNDHKKLARRKVLQEGVMNTFFEYFDQGHTNEEIVQLYAEKGVNVPEQFVGKARKQHEQYSKMKFELEMSEKAFKNEASQIVNNPATMEMDGTVLDDDKQLASGLFKEQEEKPDTPEKEQSDVKAMDDELKNINTPEEFTAILDKVLDRANSISGMSDTKIKALLMKSIKEL